MPVRRNVTTEFVHRLERRTLFARLLALPSAHGRIESALGDGGDFANIIAIVQPIAGGKIVVGGQTGYGQEVRVARYTADGLPDTVQRRRPFARGHAAGR